MSRRNAPDPGVTIRLGRREDVPAVVRLLADDVLGASRERAEEPLPDEYWSAFDAMAAQGGNELLVATIGDEIVGCLQLTIIPGLSRTGLKRAQLDGVRVHAERRGAQIGERLIRAAVERAREAGCGMVQLTTDATRTSAQQFYERLGFVPSHIGMKLSLPTL
jgi:ribosomal protein S18 acetylase RimI-like enzyme